MLSKRSKEGGRETLICGDGRYLCISFYSAAPPFSSFFFRLATDRPTAHLICPITKQIHKKNGLTQMRVTIFYYCNGPPFPHADASSPSLVRHALHKLCFPNRLPAAQRATAVKLAACFHPPNTRLAQPYLHACPASDRSFSLSRQRFHSIQPSHTICLQGGGEGRLLRAGQ